MAEKKFDIVLMGATGFTGRLVAEFLLQRHGARGDLRWALAGRSRERLEQVRAGLGDTAVELPLMIADSHDRASLDAMVAIALFRRCITPLLPTSSASSRPSTK